MDNIQHEIELLQAEIGKANAAIQKAIRDRRASAKDSPLKIDLNAAVETARESLAAVEIKLRKLYESRDDS
jgi:hypothetical protein